MAIKYKYPNEAEVIIENANDYEIETLEDIEYSLYRVLGSYLDNESGETRGFISLNDFADLYFDDISDFSIVEEGWFSLPLSDGTRRYTNALYKIQALGESRAADILASQGTYSEFKQWWENALQQGIPNNYNMANAFGAVSHFVAWSVPFTGNRYLFDEPLTIRYSDPQITDLYLIDTGSISQYKLDIIVDGTIVFTRTETFQPEYVEIFNLECPENTCPVKCGNRVCCYGSNGTATESFLFNESVYQS